MERPSPRSSTRTNIDPDHTRQKSERRWGLSKYRRDFEDFEVRGPETLQTDVFSTFVLVSHLKYYTGLGPELVSSTTIVKVDVRTGLGPFCLCRHFLLLSESVLGRLHPVARSSPMIIQKTIPVQVWKGDLW